MTKMTLEQLKAMAYDLYVKITRTQAEARAVEQAIAEYKPEPVKEEPKEVKNE